MPRGRPKASPGTARDMVVRFRLTEREYRWVQAAAMRAGLTVGEFARALALAGMPSETPAVEGAPAEGDRLDQLLAKHPWGQ